MILQARGVNDSSNFNIAKKFIEAIIPWVPKESNLGKS